MKLLVTSALRCAPRRLDDIRALGHDVVYMQDESGNLPEGARDVEGIVCNALFLHHDATLFPNLIYVQLTSAGLDRAPVNHFSESGVTLFNAVGVYSIPLAEWALSKTLELYKRSRTHWTHQNDRQWIKLRSTPELFGKTVVIFGIGHTARAIAPRLSAFGMTIFAVSQRGPFEDSAFQQVFGIGDAEAALSQADVVISCLPLTDVTHGFFGYARFAAMKPGAVFLNVSRGAVVHEEALIQALASRRLGGAALDVFAQEPLPPESPLWGIENLLITPHDAFESDNNDDRMFTLTVKNLQLFTDTQSR